MRFLLAFSFLIASVFGETKPNFTGEWKLNPSKSDFGRLPPPASIVRKIEHKESQVRFSTTIQSAQGQVTTNYEYTTDGQPVINKVRDTEIKGKAAWDGTTLVFDTERPLPSGATVKTTEKWILSEDGKTLMWVSKMGLPQGDLTTTAVMEKQ